MQGSHQQQQLWWARGMDAQVLSVALCLADIGELEEAARTHLEVVIGRRAALGEMHEDSILAVRCGVTAHDRA